MYINRNTLIARKMTPLAGAWDTIKQIGEGGLNVFKSGEQAKGASAALQAQLAAQQAGASGGGFPTTTLLIMGALGLGAVLLLKKKKSG